MFTFIDCKPFCETTMSVGFDTIMSEQMYGNRVANIDPAVEPTSSSQSTATEKIYSRKLKRERKLKRNLGLSYMNVAGKFVRKREMKPLEMCRMKCKERIPEDTRRNLFSEYWALGEYSKRVKFISDLIDTTETKVTRKRNNVDKRNNRNTTNIFHFKIKGERVKVCRACFMKVYDVSQMFITNVIKKRGSSLSGITLHKHDDVNVNKDSDETIAKVLQHIQSFPVYESHYSRRTNKKKYLASYLNLDKMYKLYCENTILNPVSRKVYSREFHKLDLHFKVPNVDTCHTCDTLKMKIKRTEDAEKKHEFEEELKSHHVLAEKAYNSKKLDKQIAKVDSSIRSYTFDLQCLPTPYLNSSVSFYKRFLWTYNLTIHNQGTGEVTCCMWHEGAGSRGANQIATCLYTELLALPDNVKQVILYSDTSRGQNRNSHVAAMFLTLIQKKVSLEVIDHKFMVCGHSHTECDIDHSLIEKQRKDTEYSVSHPYDWYQLVRTVGKKKKFMVKEMDNQMFLDFASLLKSSLVLRKEDSSNDYFKWQQVKWFRYTKTPGEILFKTSLDEDDPFKSWSFLRRGNPNPVLEPKKCYTEPVPISYEKKKDLLSLLPLLRPEFHDFYKNLKYSNVVVDTMGDIKEFEEN